MISIDKVFYNEHLQKRIRLIVSLFLMSLATEATCSAEKPSFLTDKPKSTLEKLSDFFGGGNIKMGMPILNTRGGEEFESFTDMKSRLVETHIRLQQLAPYLCDDAIMHIQLLRSVATLINLYNRFERGFPEFTTGNLHELLRQRPSCPEQSSVYKEQPSPADDKQVLAQHERRRQAQKIVDDIKSLSSPLANSLKALEARYDISRPESFAQPGNGQVQQRKFVPPFDIEGPNFLQNLHNYLLEDSNRFTTELKISKEKQAAESSSKDEERSDILELQRLLIQEMSEALNGRVPTSTQSSPVVQHVLGAGYPRLDSPKLKRADSPKAGTGSPGGSPGSLNGEAVSSLPGGPSSPLLVSATTPRSGDSGQQIGGFANLVKERAIQRRASQSAVVGVPIADSNNDTSTKDAIGALSSDSASEVEATNQPATRKSPAPPIPLRQLKPSLKANGISAETAGSKKEG